MSSSYINPGDFQGSAVLQGGTTNNDGQIAGTIINYYGGVRPAPVTNKDLHAAEQLLAKMPEDEVSLGAPLPPGSRLPLPRNPLFVGRTEDLKTLARTLKGGATAA